MTVLFYIGVGFAGLVGSLVIAFAIELAFVGLLPGMKVPMQPGKPKGRKK